MFRKKDLQQALMMLQFVPPFARNVKGLSVGLVDVDMSKPGPIPEVHAFAVLSADQAPMLLNVLKGTKPEFAQLAFPKVGEPATELKGLPLPPPMRGLKMKVTEQGIGFALGAKGVSALEKTMSKVTPGAAPFFSFSYQVDEIFGLVKTAVAKFAPPEVKDLFSDFGTLPVNLLTVEVGFSKKGVESTSIAYPK